MFTPVESTDRRNFLKGAGGALLALPLMEANGQHAIHPPMRMVAVGVFYGILAEHFHPKTTGRDYAMPRYLKPMEHLRDKFSIFSGLDHNIGGGHNGTKYFLSGIPVTHAKGYDEANISIDQKAANFVGNMTRYPSLALGCEANTENYLSWTRSGAQVNPVQTLSGMYNLLFQQRGRKDIERERHDLLARRSILDLVHAQAGTFKKSVSKRDAEKLDQYFTSVRELELKIQQSNRWLDSDKPSTSFTLKNGVDALTLKEKVPLFFDLMTLALQTDSTRVMSLSFTGLGKDNGGLTGVSHGYHTLSHHGQVSEAMEELSIIESFYSAEFARFIDKLDNIEEPNGKTLLDNTMALFGCGMSNANSHSNRDLPVLLAGGGLHHGTHHQFARHGRQSVPLCNLYVTMLQRFGLELDQFNTSNGSLSELLPA